MKSAWKAGLIFLLILMMVCAGMTAALAEDIITLPAGLRIIEKEAFLNTAGIKNVVIPEGVQEIGPRAFAGSSVRTIMLPASLTVIAEDAFDGVANLTITGVEGSYAQTYCEAHGIPFVIKPTEPCLESDHPYKPNTDKTWQWSGKANTKRLRITFDEQTYVERNYDKIWLYDGTGKEVGEYTGAQLQGQTICVSDNAFSIRLKSDGYGQEYGFAIVSITEETEAVYEPVTIKGIYASPTTVNVNNFVTWTVEAEGTLAPFTYEYVLICDGEENLSETLNEPTGRWYLWSTGTYTMKVTVTDSMGASSMAVSDPVTVLPEPPVITSFSANVTSVEIGQNIAWELYTKNWDELTCEFVLSKDGTEIQRETLSMCHETTYQYRPYETGIYTLSVTATNDLGQSCSASAAAVTATEATTAPEEDFTYWINDDNEAVIDKYTGTSGCVIIPDTLGGVPVGVIGKAFSEYSYYYQTYTGIEHVQMVVIPDSVKRISESAFRNCPNLRLVKLGSGVKEIDDYAFADCPQLQSMDFPSSVEYLGCGALMNCTGLKQITYPVGLTQLHVSTIGIFDGCTNLKQIVVPEGVTTLVSYIFQKATGLETVVLPESLTTVGIMAFADCTSLKKITLPYNVTTVQGAAFAGCTNLEEVIMPDGVTSIDSNIFQNCISLKTFRIPAGSVDRYSFSDLFSGNMQVKLTIPEGVTEILTKQFFECGGIEEVYLPASLLEIGESAFENCANLKDVHFGKSVRRIASHAFRGCSSLREADVPDSVEYMGAGVFSNCEALESFHYPLKWEDTLVVWDPYTPVYGANQIGGCPKLTNLVVPEGVMVIPDFAFANCDNIEQIALPSTLVEIRQGAFQNCPKLRFVHIPASVMTIGTGAFTNCSNLTISCDWDSAAQEYAAKYNINHEYATLEDAAYPQGSLPVGKKFTFKGMLRSSETITALSASIYNRDGSEYLQGVDCVPNADMVGLDAALTNGLHLEELYEGRYLFRMTATIGGKKKTLAENTFDIVPEQIELETIDLVLPGDVYTEGEDFQISGGVMFYLDHDNITGAIPLDGFLMVNIIDVVKNSTVRSYVYEPDQLLVDLADANTAMSFSTLELGMYAMRVTAVVNSERRLVAESYFRIAPREENVARAKQFDAAILGKSTQLNNDLLYESVILSNRAYKACDAESHLAALGFQNIESNSINPGLHTIGHYFGWKDVVDDDGKVTRVYAIICRGTKVDSFNEWASDFTLASPEGYHHGFYLAAREVFTNFNSYVGNHAPDKWAPQEYKVWVAGHSRGAAVANILGGGWLVDAGYTRSNVFTYTFACPNVYKGTAPAANNVFNYNIGGDLVPNVPVEAWGFSRYGSTVTYPNGEQYMGVNLTDYKTMQNLVNLFSKIQLVDALEINFNAALESLDVISVEEVLSLYVVTLVELAVRAGIDPSNWPDIAEVIKDIGPTHDSRTYINWISNITGR